MKRIGLAAWGAVLFWALVGVSLVTGASEKLAIEQPIPFPEITRMEKEALKQMLGKPGLILLDVRAEEQWRLSDQMLPGAVHENPLEVKSWADKYSKEAEIVLY